MSLREHRAEVFSLLVQYFVVLSFVTALVLPLKLAFSLAAILLAIARYFLLLLREAKKQRERLEAGLLAESAVCEMLLRELPWNWSMEPNIEIPHCGDIDLFVSSPNCNHYAIEIKSHQGEVLFDGRNLRKGNGRYFEKNFLKQAARAAVKLRNMRKLSYVNPILVFTRASLSMPVRKIGPVIILSSDELVDFLISQEIRDENHPRPFASEYDIEKHLVRRCEALRN